MQTRKEGFLFVRGVAKAAGTEIVKRGLNRRTLFRGESAPCGPRSNLLQHGEKSFNAAVAVMEHADGVVKARIRFCADLNSHGTIPFLI